MVAVKLSQIVVVIINVIFLIFGLAALIVGIIFKVGWDDVRDAFVDKAEDVDINLQSAGDTLAYASIALGSIIIVVSILGCVGACCKVRVFLVIYAIFLLLLIIGEIVAVAVLAANSDEAHDKIRDAMRSALENYHEDSSTDTSKAFSALFSTLECCAIVDYKVDFRIIDETAKTNRSGFYFDSHRTGAYKDGDIPVTCCHGVDYESEFTKETFTKKYSACLTNPTKDNAYTEGCLTGVEDFIDDNKIAFIAVGATILVIEILMTVMAFFLCCRHDED